MSRPTNIINFAADLKKHPDVEKVVAVRSQSDGVAALVRVKGGNAYEITIRAAEFAQHPKIKELTMKNESFVDAILAKLEEQ